MLELFERKEMTPHGSFVVNAGLATRNLKRRQMTTFREFQAELERLHSEEARKRRLDKGLAIAQIRALIEEYRLTSEELEQFLLDAHQPWTVTK